MKGYSWRIRIRMLIAVCFLLVIAAAGLINWRLVAKPAQDFMAGSSQFHEITENIEKEYQSGDFFPRQVMINLNGLAARIAGFRHYNGVVLLSGNTLAGELIWVVGNPKIDNRDEIRPLGVEHADDAHYIRDQGGNAVFLNGLLDEVEGFIRIIRSVIKFTLEPVHAGHDLDTGDRTHENTLHIPADFSPAAQSAQVPELRMAAKESLFALGDEERIRFLKEPAGGRSTHTAEKNR